MTAVAAVAPKRFRLSPPVVPEVDLQASVADALNLFLLKPARWTAFPAGHVLLSPAQGTRLKRIGLARGWPDLLVVYDGAVFGIELKARGGRLSKTRLVRTKRRGALRLVEGQVEVFAELTLAGMRIAVCDTVEGVLCALAAWQIPIRRQS